MPGRLCSRIAASSKVPSLSSCVSWLALSAWAASRARCGQSPAARSASDALARVRRVAGPDGLVVVAGSIYLVAELRAKLLGLRSDPPIRM